MASFASRGAVCFESQPPDKRGLHSAVVRGKDCGIFPPNTLFALSHTLKGGFWYAQKCLHARNAVAAVRRGPDGGQRWVTSARYQVEGMRERMWVKQDLLVVRATWRSPGALADGHNSKMSDQEQYKLYGSVCLAADHVHERPSSKRP